MLARVPHLVTVEEVIRMKIHDLKPAPGAKNARRRVGRGIAGKGGKTAGRGTKGQGARGNIAPRFEGGQTPLHRRTPKAKGFKNPFRVEYVVVNLDTLEALDAGSRGRPRRAALARPRGQARPGQGPRPGRAHQGAHRAGPRLLAEARSAPSRVPAAGSRSSRRRGATGVRRPRATPSPTGKLAAPDPLARFPTGLRTVERRSSPRCCPACGTCSGCPTCATRSSSRSSIIAVYRVGSAPPGSVRRLRRDQAAAEHAEQRRRRRLPRPLLRRRDHQRRDLLPRDHAVHHGVDHHAAARRRDPEARAVAERGPDRAEEDHAVDPLRHRRPRRSCSRPGSCSRCTRARAACSASPASRART